MRTACAALLLAAALALPARAGCGPVEAKPEADKARGDLKALAARLEQVREALADEKKHLAEADAAHRQKVEALERELTAVRKERERVLAGKLDKVRRLAEVQAVLEAKLAELKPLAERAPPAAKGRAVGDKLDLILKKLDDLERRLRKLEGEP